MLDLQAVDTDENPCKQLKSKSNWSHSVILNAEPSIFE